MEINQFRTHIFRKCIVDGQLDTDHMAKMT